MIRFKKKTSLIRPNFFCAEGVYRCDVDTRSNKVTVTAGNFSANALIRRLRKNAERWPEEHKQQQEHLTGDKKSPGETKNQTTEPYEPVAPTEKPTSGDSDADANAGEAEPTSAAAAVELKKIAGETAMAAARKRAERQWRCPRRRRWRHGQRAKEEK